MKKLIATWVDERFLEDVDQLAGSFRMSRSDLIRLALEKVVAQNTGARPGVPALLRAQPLNPNKGERGR